MQDCGLLDVSAISFYAQLVKWSKINLFSSYQLQHMGNTFISTIRQDLDENDHVKAQIYLRCRRWADPSAGPSTPSGSSSTPWIKP
jgi:hypothetical protein